jgi:hypothetical protein
MGCRPSDLIHIQQVRSVMPDEHGPAMPQVTAVDDQFGTHSLPGAHFATPNNLTVPLVA